MRVNEKDYRTICLDKKNKYVSIIDQTQLPHKFVIEKLEHPNDFVRAIKDMHVRGAGLIGVTAAYGMYIASLKAPEENFDVYMKSIAQELKSTRPTAVNLAWAVDQQLEEIEKYNFIDSARNALLERANKICEEEVNSCKKIGINGLELITNLSEKKCKKEVNILTHCNAGWLAFVDYGSALSPIYLANKSGIDVHVWVDMTSPWNQGAKLTAWELQQEKVPYTIISDNTGGHLMQKRLVDMVIVGADRVTKKGDVVNKIGTYLKALSAKDNNIPFYVAFPSSTFDWKIENSNYIQIEKRSGEEVKYTQGIDEKGKITRVLLTPKESNALNYAFDITPARLITKLITEKGVFNANKKDILKIYPEHKND
jgi:methylthioribose-1-phosphate isomerase